METVLLYGKGNSGVKLGRERFRGFFATDSKTEEIRIADSLPRLKSGVSLIRPCVTEQSQVPNWMLRLLPDFTRQRLSTIQDSLSEESALRHSYLGRPQRTQKCDGAGIAAFQCNGEWCPMIGMSAVVSIGACGDQ